MTKIGWTHWPGYIGVTINLTGGCERVHTGCKNCYAERMTFRLPHMGMLQYDGLAEKTASGVRFTGDVRLFPDVLGQIETWTKPRCVFVNSMSDLFQEKVQKPFIFRAWSLMETVNEHRRTIGQAPHIFLFLTKRPERMAALWAEWVDVFVQGPNFPFSGFGFGCSVSDQKTAEMMIPPLLEIEHGFRFVSVEPMIGPTVIFKWLTKNNPASKSDVDRWHGGTADRMQVANGIDWCLVGCESGPKRRPMELDWARSIRYQCAEAGVPFYLKQLTDPRGRPIPLEQWPDDLRVQEFPKVGGGR